jgi:uncharacterized small protein (DUF1192 family)
MVMTRLSDSADLEQSLGNENAAPVAELLETIAILQDEVTRLEQELQSRDASQREQTSNEGASCQEEIELAKAANNDDPVSGSDARFKAELASREETIRLLLDELSRLEAAQAATQAEWEHLAGWMAELEHRVEGQDESALHRLEDRLAMEQQKLCALEAKSDQDRRAWEAQRQIYQDEIAGLRRTFDQIAQSPEADPARDGRILQDGSSDATVVEALQAENLRLRAAWQEQRERASAAAARSVAMETKLVQSLAEQHQLRNQLEQIEDERKRERLEHEANVAELQARLSQTALARPQERPPEKGAEAVSPERDIELRVRALRQHLVEIDEREKEERRQKQLITRLSRLWSRTGPRSGA